MNRTPLLVLIIGFFLFYFEGSCSVNQKPHRLNFDFSFVEQALKYLESGDEKILDNLAQEPAAAHLYRHARDMDPGELTDSPLSLVKSLLTPREEKIDSIPLVKRNLAYARKYVEEDKTFLQAVLSLLPPDFFYDGSLFFTYGYDIGVAHGNNASLNLAHPKFLKNPREIIFYAAHELHHVGFMRYNPFPVLDNLITADDLLHLIEYATQMEGMAVYATYRMREDVGLLSEDDDCAAILDEDWIRENEETYFSLYDEFNSRTTQKIKDEDWAIIEVFSDKKRLWYRIGCRMAMSIEKSKGREYLIQLMLDGPSLFIQEYLELKSLT